MDYQLRLSPNMGGPLATPSLIVLHYTAGASFDSSVAWLRNKAAKASAHLVIGKAGEVCQLAPFNRVAWHAGASSYKGRAAVNSFSIGIELDNAGCLLKGKDGTFKNPSGVLVPESQVFHGRSKDASCAFEYWDSFPEAQLLKLDAVVKDLLDRYPSINAICGHSDVSPGRKLDPGPAFDFTRLPQLP